MSVTADSLLVSYPEKSAETESNWAGDGAILAPRYNRR